MARLGEVECLGKTRDVSIGGLGVAIQGVQPSPGDAIRVEVVFEGEVRGFRGRVVHSHPMAWGSLLGVRCEGGDAGLEEFLARRYTPGSEALGSVT